MRYFPIIMAICLVLTIPLKVQGDQLLAPNDDAPAFKAKTFDDQAIESSAIYKDHPLVLIFLRGFG